MENRKLIPMVDYVLKISDLINDNETYVEDKCRQMEACEVYAEFLKQTPELKHFVPCGKDGMPLEEPIDNTCKNCDHKKGEDICCHFEAWHEAKESVLFDGLKLIHESQGYAQLELKNADLFITFHDGKIYFENELYEKDIPIYNIESLIELDLTLTEETAKKLRL
ncbi:hypothetical protein [Flavobacterium sp.]|uniref:hypothetical protein n=1 Tax=Flavobacterium sp. TaxID=239 RepID=UPI003D6C1C82